MVSCDGMVMGEVVIVYGPGYLRCTSKRDQLRVIQIWSLVGGDYKKL